MTWQKYEPRVTLDLQRKQIVQVHRHRGFRHIWHPVITTWEDNQFRCIIIIIIVIIIIIIIIITSLDV